jgi:hypothetical protein
VTRDALEARLGPPLTTDAAYTLSSGRAIGCDVYRGPNSPGPESAAYAFCFDHGRLVVKVSLQ